MHVSTLLAMGGYGAYVWPAYVITLGVFGINLATTFFEKNRVKKFLKNYHE